MNSKMFDKISFFATSLVLVLLPFFFLPFTKIPIETAKSLLLVVGILVSMISWGVARFFDGNIVLPRSGSVLAFLGVVVVFFLSAFFSKSPNGSFFGTMFDVGSAWFMLLSFAVMLLSAVIFSDAKKAKLLLFGVIVSSFVLLVFQTLHIFIPSVSSLGIISGKSDNLLGSWIALGLFAGFSGLMSLLVLEFFTTTKIEKLILQISILLSIFFIAVVNFPLTWAFFGFFALILFVYKLSLSSKKRILEGGEKVDFPVLPFVAVLISLLFFISGSFIGGLLPSRLGLSSTEVRPTLSTTMTVTKGVLNAHPFLGIGPNKFGTAWAQYKPININASIGGNDFWDMYFASGSGLIPTLFSTTGYLGILSLLLFFALFIMQGIKSIFSSIKSGTHWEIVAFFILSLYLFVSAFFYGVGIVLFIFAVAFAGVFFGLSSGLHKKGEISILFLNDYRKSFFSIFLLIVLVLVSAVFLFKFVERFCSVVYFRRALTAQTIPDAEKNINKALSFYVNDLYLRTYSQIYIVKLNSLVQKGNALTDIDKVDLKNSLDQAGVGAKSAIDFDNTNYLNYKIAGFVYQTASSLGDKDSIDKAIDMYKMASTLNPNNPGLKLSLASVSILASRPKDAEAYVKESLSLKPDYFDALITMSQILKMEGDTTGAVSYAEQALKLTPQNKDLLKYIETLKTKTAPAPDPKTTTKTPAKTTTKKP